MVMEKLTDMDSIETRIQEFRKYGDIADIAVITGASSGLGVKFLEAVVNRYPQMDEYWILARRKEICD